MPEERNYHVSVLLSTFNLVSLSHLFGRRLAIHGSLESKGVSTSSIFVNHKHNFDKINFDTSAILTMYTRNHYNRNDRKEVCAYLLILKYSLKSCMCLVPSLFGITCAVDEYLNP